MRASSIHDNATIKVTTNALLYCVFGDAIVPLDDATTKLAFATGRVGCLSVLRAAALVGALRQRHRKLAIAV